MIPFKLGAPGWVVVGLGLAIVACVVTLAALLDSHLLWRRSTCTYHGGPLDGDTHTEHWDRPAEVKYWDKTVFKFPSHYALYRRRRDSRVYDYMGEVDGRE